jgi:hypothetical protein
MKTRKLHVYDFEVDKVIAYSKNDATDLLRAYYRTTMGQEYPETRSATLAQCSRIDDSVVLKIFWDTERDTINDSGPTLDLTASEWVKKLGRGYLCTTEL